MGRKLSLFAFGILVLLVVLLVEACAGGAPVAAPGATSASPSPPATPAKHRTLRMMIAAEPSPDQVSTIYGASGPTSEPLTQNVMEPLVDYTRDGPVARLAIKWEPSADFTKWRFYLRKGVKFHNGTDFTAHDVVEYGKRIFEERKLSRVYANVPIKEAVAVDDYTVDLMFEKPQSLLLIAQRIFLIPPTAISRDNPELAKTQPMGTGPYRFVEWNKGQDIKLARFEGYWGPKPQIDEVVITFRPEEGVRVAALQAGEADWVYALSPESASRAPKVVRMHSSETAWLRFDESVQKDWTKEDPIFADKRLRVAVEYAIDRQKLVALYGGFATLSLGQFGSPGDFGFNPNLKSRPYDLEKSRALVREASAVGKTVTFVAATDMFSKNREVAEAVAYMIEQTGLNVKLMLMPKAEARKYIFTTGEDRKLMADIVLFLTDALLEVEARFPWLFVEGGLFNATPDPEPARLYKEVLAEADFAKRGEKLGRAWAYVYEQAHYVPVFKLEWIWAIAKNLEWDPGIAGTPFFANMRFTD